MNTNPITPETLAASVISVPPLARNSDLSLNAAENEKQIRHLEAGGVTTLLYGGNAILYHMALTEYADFVDMLAEQAGDQTLVIPSVGPAYGMETLVDDTIAEQPEIYFEAGDHEQLIQVSTEVFEALMGDRVQHGQFSH